MSELGERSHCEGIQNLTQPFGQKLRWKGLKVEKWTVENLLKFFFENFSSLHWSSGTDFSSPLSNFIYCVVMYVRELSSSIMELSTCPVQRRFKMWSWAKCGKVLRRRWKDNDNGGEKSRQKLQRWSFLFKSHHQVAPSHSGLSTVCSYHDYLMAF